jgi:hypothetical protein
MQFGQKNVFRAVRVVPEAGALYVMDRGYIDFGRLYRLHQARGLADAA